MITLALGRVLGYSGDQYSANDQRAAQCAIPD